MAAMAEVVKRYGDAATQVQFGKIATLRGYAFDEMAFPASGVPAFLPLAHSADLASVYAVARQESEFVWRAASGAGAKGLMQILPSTAASTAQAGRRGLRLRAAARRSGLQHPARRGLPRPGDGGSSAARLNWPSPPTTRDRDASRNGSRPMAIRATASADLVDWVERIPFDETRDYVQRVSENLAVYRQRFADEPPPPAPVSVFAARE